MSREGELETALRDLYDVAQKCLRPKPGEKFEGAAAVQLTTRALMNAARILGLPQPPHFGVGDPLRRTSGPQWTPSEEDILR